MIALSRLNGEKFVLNADFIEMVEETPDTVITLTNGKKMMVKDKVDYIVNKTIEYKRLSSQSFQVIKKEKVD